MPYIVIRTTRDRLAELEQYRYGWTTEVPWEDWDTEDRYVKTWQCDDAVRAQGQADRLSSGMFAARVCETSEEIDAVVEEWGFTLKD